MTFNTIVEQTELDVNSKKQWMFIWGRTLILKLNFLLCQKTSIEKIFANSDIICIQKVNKRIISFS